MVKVTVTKKQRERMEWSRRKALEIRAAAAGVSKVFGCSIKAWEQVSVPPTAVSNSSNYNISQETGHQRTYIDNRTVVYGDCVQTSEDRFKVEAKYNIQLVDIFKRIPDSFDPSTKSWNFPESEYGNLRAAADSLLPMVILRP